MYSCLLILAICSCLSSYCKYFWRECQLSKENAYAPAPIDNYSSAEACLGLLGQSDFCLRASVYVGLREISLSDPTSACYWFYSLEWVTGHELSLTGVKGICVPCWFLGLREAANPALRFAKEEQCLPVQRPPQGTMVQADCRKGLQVDLNLRWLGWSWCFPPVCEDQPLTQPEESCPMLGAAGGGHCLDSKHSALLNPGKKVALPVFGY